MTETLVAVRNSERAKYRDCRQAWHWSYQKLLEPSYRKGALTFGTLIHDSLEPWYVPGRDRGTYPVDTFVRLFNENSQEFDQWDDEGNRVPADELGRAMLYEYVEHWGDDDNIEIVQPEMAFQVDVYDHRDNYLATLVGRFDAIALNVRTGRYFVFEHKTGKSIEYVRLTSKYGEQGLSYFWAANYWLRHVLGEDIELSGVGFNWLRKALPDDRPVNEEGLRLNLNGTVSKRQPLDFFARQMLRLSTEQLDTFNKRLRRELFEISMARKGKLPIYKNPGQHCAWCDFRDVCELHEVGADWRDVLDIEFRRWDPYSDHELHLELAR